MLYWTDLNAYRPAIYRSSVINPAAEIFIDGSFYWPTALAADFSGKNRHKVSNGYSSLELCKYGA